MKKFVVVDCETTGLGKHDRLVEVAAVTVDPDSLEIVDEYDTLINPERDMGPVNIHGVTASMVEAAPSFGEIAAALGARLDNAVLVAHNLAFDTRMIGLEYERADVGFDPGAGICTLSRTREKLILACERFGIALDHQHRALADARATASLLSHVLDDDASGQPAAVAMHGLKVNPRTLRRDASDKSGNSNLARTVSRARYPSSTDSVVQYLDMLDWVLDDLEIDDLERSAMTQLAEQLGLTPHQVQAAHEDYLSAIVAAARRDGVITQQEHEIILRVSDNLNLQRPEINVTSTSAGSGEITPGQRVCFTGTAVVGGVNFGRTELEAIAARAGLQPVPSVSKKGCDLLVVADPSSMSGKAKKARDFAIPIMTVEEFLSRCV